MRMVETWQNTHTHTHTEREREYEFLTNDSKLS